MTREREVGLYFLPIWPTIIFQNRFCSIMQSIIHLVKRRVFSLCFSEHNSWHFSIRILYSSGGGGFFFRNMLSCCAERKRSGGENKNGASKDGIWGESLGKARLLACTIAGLNNNHQHHHFLFNHCTTLSFWNLLKFGILLWNHNLYNL